MKFRVVSAVLALAVFATGCAHHVQEPVEMKAAAVSTQGTRVGVLMTDLPKANTFFPGAGCLLCMATAEMANSSLTKHTKTLALEDLPTLKDQAATLLRKKGLVVTVISDKIDLDGLPSHSTDGVNVAAKDYAALAQRYQLDKLVVLSVNMVGFTRPYSAYVSNGDPKAVFSGVGYMVDLKSNAYDWYSAPNITRAANGTWDEAPNFPGLTNAYYEVLELGKDAFLKPLAQ
jgi:hypothetical protein